MSDALGTLHQPLTPGQVLARVLIADKEDHRDALAVVGAIDRATGPAIFASPTPAEAQQAIAAATITLPIRRRLSSLQFLTAH